jgi:toxin CcdB
MGRFQVYRLKSGDTLAMDIQADLLGDLPSRMMAPLYAAEDMSWSILSLNPRFMINGRLYAMATQRMAAVQIREIGDAVADLSPRSDEITAALDFLFQGF